VQPTASAPVPVRAAGQHARAMQRRHAHRAVAVIAAICAVVLIVGLASGLGWLTVAVEALAIAAMLLVDRYATPTIDRWRRGAQGEEHVGAILDGMHDDGWFAIHDVSVGHGNIDHIVIGPAGVFTIETKSHPGRIKADRIESRMLKRAYAEAKLVERITGMKVQPLLVFSRAYLIPAVCRREGVVILPARMLPGRLARLPVKLSAEQTAVLHARLAAAVLA
jgi:nuclease-like protein